MSARSKLSCFTTARGTVNHHQHNHHHRCDEHRRKIEKRPNTATSANMAHQHTCCNSSNGPRPAQQTMEDMEFERSIWYAAYQGDVDRITLLLERGFSVDSVDSAGYTPLHYAARNGQIAATKLLLDRGAPINATTRSCHSTSLHRACFTGMLPVVKTLIERKADLFWKDVCGKTCLHRAVEGDNVAVCRLLLDKAPKLRDMTDTSGKMPVDYAKNKDIVAILQKPPDYQRPIPPVPDVQATVM